MDTFVLPPKKNRKFLIILQGHFIKDKPYTYSWRVSNHNLMVKIHTLQFNYFKALTKSSTEYVVHILSGFVN